jgi:hypothetical protein
MAVRQDRKRKRTTEPAPPTPLPPPVPDREAVEESMLGELAAMADQLEQLELDRDRLYARRRELYMRGREMTPPISGAAMARAARVSDAALVLSARRLNKAS